jgi:hypothetical protein
VQASRTRRTFRLDEAEGLNFALSFSGVAASGAAKESRTVPEPDGGVPATGIVPCLDELEDGHARLGVGAEASPIEQLAFEGREKLSQSALS